MKVLHQSDEISSHIKKYCWNGIYSHECANNISKCKPTAIYLPENEQDFVSILETQILPFKIPFAIKSGGHSIAGDCLPKVPNSILIDLQKMNQILLLENTSKLFSFQVQSGCLLKQIDEFCAKYQVVLPAGMVSHTGIAGLTLGGGLGWLTRWLGLTSDYVTSYRIFYNNQIINVDAKGMYKELFYQLQGNGTIIKEQTKQCIVISFTFSIPKEIIKEWQNRIIMIQWQFQPETNQNYEELVEDYFKICKEIHSNEISCFGFAEKPYFVIILVYPLFCEKMKQTELDNQVDSIIQQFMKHKPICMNIEEEMTYCALQKNFDSGVPHGKSYYWKSLFVDSEQEWNAKKLAKAVNEYLEQVSLTSDMRCSVEIMHLGGALQTNKQKEYSSFQFRDCPFEMHTILHWEDYQPHSLQIAKEAGKLFTKILCKDNLTLAKGYVNFLVEQE